MARIELPEAGCVSQKQPIIQMNSAQLGIALALCVCAMVVCLGSFAGAQTPASSLTSLGTQPENLQSPGNGIPGNGAGQQRGVGSGAAGGSSQADFDSLIDLIQSTVAADSWIDNGTGEGEIRPFPSGVFVDAAGTLRLSVQGQTDKNRSILDPSAMGKISASLRRGRRKLSSSTPVIKNAHFPSKLRFVSLPRLERAIALQQRQHRPLSIDMLTMAGLQRVEYVMVCPPTEDFPVGDLILAGPAGDWFVQPSGRIVALESGRPIVRLDDLLVLLRRNQTFQRASFGCSITPRQARLAATQDYLRQTGKQPLEPGGRNRWLTGLRDTLGKQDVEFFGISPQTHASRVLLAADYHMKLIGMGLVDGVANVDSYLSTVTLSANGALPPLSVLRWWFTMKYDPLATNTAHDTFQILGPGVQVLSENELLAARGRRVHTGQSDELNDRFATTFTAAFESLSQKYPIYAELKNLFDLALVVALLETERLCERAGWQQGLLTDSRRLRLPAVATPKHVDTVINHRVLGGRHILAGVSGGVWLDARQVLRIQKMDQAAEPATGQATGEMATGRVRTAAPPSGDVTTWWWD